MLDTMTRGYRFRKIVAIRPTMATALAMNAQPCSFSRMSHPTTATAATARIGTNGGTMPTSWALRAFT